MFRFRSTSSFAVAPLATFALVVALGSSACSSSPADDSCAGGACDDARGGTKNSGAGGKNAAGSGSGSGGQSSVGNGGASGGATNNGGAASGTGGVPGGTAGDAGNGGSSGSAGGSSSGPTFHVILLLGQSNMAGYPKAQAADKVEDARIKVLGYDDCSATGRRANQWDTAAPPLHECWNGAIGPGDYFAKTLIDELPAEDTIGLVPCAISGEKVETFMKSGGTKYTWIVDRAKLAQQAGGVIQGILFHQGESNTNDPAWPGKVKTLVNDLRADLALGTVPFIAGELLRSGSSASHNTLVNQLPSQITNAHVVSSNGLTEDPGDAQWNLHFSHDAQVTLGQRYAAKFLEVVGGSL